MRRAGLLETMASNDLEILTQAVGRRYRTGSVDRLLAQEPAWREDVERAEREVGALYAELCAADATVRRWREAVTELQRVWSRVNEAPAERAAPVLEPVLEEVA